MRKPLTSLRALVVFTVFIAHTRFLFLDTPFHNFHETYFINGEICVTFFFVLSGLSFSLGYGDRFETLSPADWGSFVWKRFKKLYPLYLLTNLVMLTWYALTARDTGQYLSEQALNIVRMVTLTQSVTTMLGSSQLFNGASWFLSTLMVLYLVAPLLLYLNRLVRHRPQATVVILVLAILIRCIIGICLTYGGVAEPLRSELDYSHPAGRMFQFVAGIMLGNLIVQAERGEGPISLSTDFAFSTGLEIASLVLWFACYLFAVPLAARLAPADAPFAFRFVASYPVHFMVSCLVCWVFANNAGAVSRLLSAQLPVELGKASFEFFLIHWLVIHTLGAILMTMEPRIPFKAIVPIVFVVSLALALLWRRLGEIMHKPFADLESDNAQNPA